MKSKNMKVYISISKKKKKKKKKKKIFEASFINNKNIKLKIKWEIKKRVQFLLM